MKYGFCLTFCEGISEETYYWICPDIVVIFIAIFAGIMYNKIEYM
jgi:hypothetical protein